VSSGQGTASTSKVEKDLWVDRYRPRRYTDLLGDDRVHREVMAWLKEWDWCVFGKGKRKKIIEDDGERNLDEYRRPREKVCCQK
jgi:chromosome transmission fidelity protein 18